MLNKQNLQKMTKMLLCSSCYLFNISSCEDYLALHLEENMDSPSGFSISNVSLNCKHNLSPEIRLFVYTMLVILAI